jgi:hypothetical protein
LGEAISFPHAGVKLALPVGFKLQQLAHINKVFVAAQNASGGSRPRSIALSVYPLEGKVTKREFMNQMIAQAKREPSIQNVEVVEETSYPTELLTSDPAAQAYLKEHPEEEGEILAFVASIRGGMIQGIKPE